MANVPAHQSTDEYAVMATASDQFLSVPKTGQAEAVQSGAGSSGTAGLYYQPNLISDEEAFVIPHAISDYARY
ncbi:MAG: hypothetical protein AAFV95_24535 [Bacteroidota bacterium]